MEAAQSYCDGVIAELGVWKGKIHDVVSRIDSLSSGDKAKMGDHVNELHMFIGELENRVDRLEHECATDWEPGQIEMKVKLSEKYINY